MAFVGLGHIGARVARYAQALGMRVTGITRSPEPNRRDELGLARLGGVPDLLEVLADTDSVVLAVPLVAENMIMTPHVAGWTDGTARYRWAEIADNLRRLQAGEPLLNVVKPASTR